MVLRRRNSLTGNGTRDRRERGWEDMAGGPYTPIGPAYEILDQRWRVRSERGEEGSGGDARVRLRTVTHTVWLKPKNGWKWIRRDPDSTYTESAKRKKHRGEALNVARRLAEKEWNDDRERFDRYRLRVYMGHMVYPLIVFVYEGSGSEYNVEHQVYPIETTIVKDKPTTTQAN